MMFINVQASVWCSSMFTSVITRRRLYLILYVGELASASWSIGELTGYPQKGLENSSVINDLSLSRSCNTQTQLTVLWLLLCYTHVHVNIIAFCFILLKETSREQGNINYQNHDEEKKTSFSKFGKAITK